MRLTLLSGQSYDLSYFESYLVICTCVMMFPFPKIKIIENILKHGVVTKATSLMNIHKHRKQRKIDMELWKILRLLIRGDCCYNKQQWLQQVYVKWFICVYRLASSLIRAHSLWQDDVRRWWRWGRINCLNNSYKKVSGARVEAEKLSVLLLRQINFSVSSAHNEMAMLAEGSKRTEW